MRIGIDARFLTHPQAGGFKTYTQNLIRGLAALDRQNEYLLYTDRRMKDLSGFDDNIEVKPIGGMAVLREQFFLPMALENDSADIGHFLCNTAPLAKPCRTVVTIHDLIPCLPQWRRKGRSGPRQRLLSAYWRGFMPLAAKRADHIITVSEASKADICRIFRIKPERVTVVPTGLHPDFKPVMDESEIKRVRDRYRLPDSFVLGFASSDPRKNVKRVIEAMRILSGNVGGVGLVLICASTEAREMVNRYVGQRGLPDFRICTLDAVPRRDLVIIYNLAAALAFPSLYEGFGLPVVEAMACGTPVVTSNVSSLPEVAGDAALIVDPKDPAAIADSLTRVVTNKDLKAELVEKGIRRAAGYGWQRTVRETVSVYERVLYGSVTAPRAQTAGGRIR